MRPSEGGQNYRLFHQARIMSFTVTVQPSGRTFSVDRDEPILTAAIRQGIGLPYGCKDGACGSCKSRLLEGRVIHGAHQLKTLTIEEEDRVLAEVEAEIAREEQGDTGPDVISSDGPGGRR